MQTRGRQIADESSAATFAKVCECDLGTLSRQIGGHASNQIRGKQVQDYLKEQKLNKLLLPPTTEHTMRQRRLKWSLPLATLPAVLRTDQRVPMFNTR